jgi:hypothetical protein
LIRKPSGGERAWFLEEESEPRNKRIFLAGENPRADESAYLTAVEFVTVLEMLPSATQKHFYCLILEHSL